MKITVITICYNSAATIADTIDSVVAQDYDDVEYIVVDGLSTDETPEIIQSYGSKITRFISEKDNGIYDAINKGVKAATGDAIGLLHSDDIFAGAGVLSEIAGTFSNTETEAVYGDLVYVNKDDTGEIFRNWEAGSYFQGLFKKGWMPPHPTFYVKKEVYDRLGLYNTDLQFAADYELMLRFIHKHRIRLQYIPKTLVKMRVGGKSNVSFYNRLKANREDMLAWRINNLKPGLFTRILKPLSKIGQFIKRNP